MGYQSAGPNGFAICAIVNVLSVPGSVWSLGSFESAGAGMAAPAGGGTVIPYAQAGCPGGVGGAYCAPSAAMAAKGMTARSPKPKNRRIESALLMVVTDRWV